MKGDRISRHDNSRPTVALPRSKGTYGGAGRNLNLAFGPDDEEDFLAAQASLLDRFARWLLEERPVEGDPEEMADDVGVALSWKWGYGDGDLGRWRTGDVGEFLLHWCPRKLSVSQADCASIPASLAAFAAFLDDEALLAPGSSTVADLAAATASMTERFVAAMGDASNFGMAKSLFNSAAADGVDMSNPQEMQEWIAEFNARSEDDRHRVIPDRVLAKPARPSLPPVAQPDPAEVAASQAEAPILATFAALAEFVGEGRKLTQTGRLTLADARVLVDLLGSGDLMDEQIGDRTFKTKSSAELPRLRQVFAWARKAGIVRVTHGRVIATKKGIDLARNPAQFFERAVDALMAIGPLTSQRDPDGWFAWPEVTELLDRFTVHLLTGPYVAQRPVPLEDMASIATQAVLDAFEFRALDDEGVARRVATDVVDIVDALELAGVVCRTDVVDRSDSDLPGGRRRHGGSVELTAAGVATTRRLLTEAGYDVPSAGRFSNATATQLLLGTDHDEFGALWGEVEAWRRRRDPTQAAAELATAVRELQDPALRNLALALMGDLGPDVAGAEVRALATDPGTRGFALCWLVDHGLEEQAVLFDPDDPSWFVDVLIQRLVTGGPDSLCDTLGIAGDHDAQVNVIGRLWRSPSNATDGVLAAIGELHPERVVAKAARKARFQRRSWLGT